ncbi:MAG: hypothetical protein ABGY71_08890 [bacterium]|nr:hypothetical protein [Planctomycetota bacterium]HIL53200.1 hypothetical protein [Planctomycetota bacterium]
MTYPDPLVRAELEHWIEQQLDVTLVTAVAELFEIKAVPMALLVNAEGRILARIPNFVAPAAFAARLRDARER